MKKKSSALVDSYAVRGRHSETEALERRRLEIKRELEKLMDDYANLTGNKELKRRHPIGSAPNDWVAEEHILG